ncbi:MAG: hypothetical protein H0T59_02320 [Chloroflexi bacterium]|nr:hypothetical protein [Chloroflexota bacterium]
MGPWDPNWRPDPTGQRLIAIRASRRGAITSAVLFGGLEFVSVMAAPPPIAAVPRDELLVALVITLFSIPALALLGAALTSAALGSRASAASAGLAIGVGVPVAAVASVMIGGFIVGGIAGGFERGADVAGDVLTTGVTAAVRISPLIAIAATGWAIVVRRLDG